MISFFSWKSNISGLGHTVRTKKLFLFIKKFYKCNYYEFDDLKKLYLLLKKNKSKIIFLDSYIFSKKISILLKEKFNKIIIRNDFQFKKENSFYYFDDFKYYEKKFDKNKKLLFGQNYCIPKKIKLKKNKNKKIILIIFNNKNQNLFYRKIKELIKDKKEYKKIFINIKSIKIKKAIKKNYNSEVHGFIRNEKIKSIADYSEIIISPGGQTLMGLIEDNHYPNVISIIKNQDYYSQILNKNKKINLIDEKNFKLKKNKLNNYISISKDKNFLKKEKLIKIFKKHESS